MVPPYSHGIPRVPRYSGYHAPTLVFEYWTITIFGLPSHAVPLTSVVLKVVRTPKILLSLVWPLPRSLATTSGISVDFFSSPYLDVSVQEVRLIYLCIQYMIHEHDFMWVSPFGHLRFNACLQLPAAFRS